MNNQAQEFTISLVKALEASMSPQADLRKQAEQFIKDNQKVQGYIIALLNISGSTEVHHTVALAAAVQLGMLVEHHWKFRDETHADKIATPGFEYIILDEATDKEQLRQSICQKMYECQQPVIIKQYVRCVRNITKLDYPERWGSLMTDNIPKLLAMQDEKAIYTGLQALLGLVQKYEYELEEDREPLFGILQTAFGILGPLINQLMQHTETQRALEILHLITKVFYTSNQLVLAPFLCDVPSKAILPWLDFFTQLMKLDVPEDLRSFTEDMDVIAERDKAIQWKIKGMAAKITYRIFSKYGNPAYQKDEYKKFQGFFQETFSESLLETHLNLIFARKTNHIGSKCLNFNIKFISAGVKIPRTMVKLQPFIENILYEVAIPIMMVTQKDQQLFVEDPIEFIRKQEDFTETLYMPKNTVIDLLQHICTHQSGGKKSKPDFLMPFLNYAVTNMQTYAAKKATGETPDWRIKEALLCAVGHLQGQIHRERSTLNAMMEPTLQTHVMPELMSEQPFLRSRACWVYGEFCGFNFKDEQHVKLAIDGVYKSLFCAELPTKLSAAIAMASMLANKVVIEFLKPALGNILEVYLKIITEIDSERLISSLEKIMSVYKDDMGPYATQIAGQLVTQYQRLIKVDVEEDDGESALAAVGCVTAIRRLLEAVNKEPEVLANLQKVIFPILMHGLTPDGLDAIEDGLDCMAIIMYYGKAISPEMWKLYPQMLYIVAGKPDDIDGGFGHEYLGPVVTCIQNFISKDITTFLTKAADQEISYLEMTFKFVQQVLLINQNSKHKMDGVTVLKTVVTLFENLPGQIDAAMPEFVGVLLAELQVLLSKKKPVEIYQSMVLQSLALAFFNNAPLTFQIMEKHQMTVPVFQSWLGFMEKFRLEFELRRVIFGMISILRCGPNDMPAVVQQRLPDLFKTTAEIVVKQFKQRMDMVEENEKDIKEEQDEQAKDSAAKDGKQEDDMEDDFEDEDDDDYGDEDAEFEKTKKQLMNFKNGTLADDDDDDDDDSDYECAGGDMNLYDSKLDEMDELNYMKETMQVLMQNQEFAQKIIGGFNTAELLEKLGQTDTLKAREKASLDASEYLAQRSGLM